MARVTVEDCEKKVSNRFELVVLSSQRARYLSAGAEITIERDNDKNSVVSLREIAAGTVCVDDLRNTTLVNLKNAMDRESVLDNMVDNASVEASTAELSLTGKIDTVESQLEAEFAALEQSMKADSDNEESDS